MCESEDKSMMQDNNSSNVIQLSDWRAAPVAASSSAVPKIRTIDDLLADRWSRLIAWVIQLWRRTLPAEPDHAKTQMPGVVIDYPEAPRRAAATDPRTDLRSVDL